MDKKFIAIIASIFILPLLIAGILATSHEQISASQSSAPGQQKMQESEDCTISNPVHMYLFLRWVQGM